MCPYREVPQPSLNLSVILYLPFSDPSSNSPSQGNALLRSPYHNKGSAHPVQERKDFNLHGLLPPHVSTLEEQVERAYEQYSSRPDDLAKNTFMTSMKEQNEVLYYRVRFLVKGRGEMGCFGALR